jgi:hypothetical protein
VDDCAAVGAAGDLRFELDAGSFVVTPKGKACGEDRRSCEVSCVVNDGGGRKYAVIFGVGMDAGNGWRVDGVQLN